MLIKKIRLKSYCRQDSCQWFVAGADKRGTVWRRSGRVSRSDRGIREEVQREAETTGDSDALLL